MARNKYDKKAAETLQRLSTDMLILEFELTEVINDKHVPVVRGWIMEELERRNPEAFNAWLDDEDFDCSSRKYFC